jgi:hypothetical protein
MDLDKALRDLYMEKKRLDRAIVRLEARLALLSGLPRSRRGRKTMNAEERLEVSRRMSAYWAARRARSGPLKGNTDAEPVGDEV